jgi:hypothetical protein
MTITIRTWDRVPRFRVIRVRVRVIRVRVMGIGYFAHAYLAPPLHWSQVVVNHRIICASEPF